MFRAYRPCHKNQQEEKSLLVLVYVFREGTWHHFFIDLWFTLDPFWEVFGLKNREKQVLERDEKTALKKVMQARGKVMRERQDEGRWLPLII